MTLYRAYRLMIGRIIMTMRVACMARYIATVHESCAYVNTVFVDRSWDLPIWFF